MGDEKPNQETEASDGILSNPMDYLTPADGDQEDSDKYDFAITPDLPDGKSAYDLQQEERRRATQQAASRQQDRDRRMAGWWISNGAHQIVSPVGSERLVANGVQVDLAFTERILDNYSPLDSLPQGKKATLELLRRTGRTHRMLSAAVTAAMANKEVVVVFASHREVVEAPVRMITVIGRVSHGVSGSPSVLQNVMSHMTFIDMDDLRFSWEPVPSYQGCRDAIVLVDHYAAESYIKGALHEAHHFDPSLKLVSESCAHGVPLLTPTAGLEWCRQCGALIYAGKVFFPGKLINENVSSDNGQIQEEPVQESPFPFASDLGNQE